MCVCIYVCVCIHVSSIVRKGIGDAREGEGREEGVEEIRVEGDGRERR